MRLQKKKKERRDQFTHQNFKEEKTNKKDGRRMVLTADQREFLQKERMFDPYLILISALHPPLQNFAGRIHANTWPAQVDPFHARNTP